MELEYVKPQFYYMFGWIGWMEPRFSPFDMQSHLLSRTTYYSKWFPILSVFCNHAGRSFLRKIQLARANQSTSTDLG